MATSERRLVSETALNQEIDLRLKVTNVALDEDGTPYFEQGATAAQILLDPEDGNPYFVITS